MIEEDKKLREQIIKVVRWLAKNKNHAKYNKGKLWLVEKIKDNDLEEWFSNLDEDVNIIFEVCKSLTGERDIVDVVKEIFDVKD